MFGASFGRYNVRVGPLPTTIGLLTRLTSLVDYGAIEGTLPSQIGRMVALEELEFDLQDATTSQQSLLRGPLPTSIINLRRLTALRFIDTAALDGTLPIELVSLPSLTALIITGTNVSGTLPRPIASPALRYLDLSSNRFTGTVPDLDRLSQLTGLRLHANQFTGIGAMPPSNLRTCSLSLSGTADLNCFPCPPRAAGFSSCACVNRTCSAVLPTPPASAVPTPATVVAPTPLPPPMPTPVPAAGPTPATLTSPQQTTLDVSTGSPTASVSEASSGPAPSGASAVGQTSVDGADEVTLGAPSASTDWVLIGAVIGAALGTALLSVLITALVCRARNRPKSEAPTAADTPVVRAYGQLPRSPSEPQLTYSAPPVNLTSGSSSDNVYVGSEAFFPAHNVYASSFPEEMESARN